MAKGEEKTDAVAVKKETDPEMWKYEDYKGNVQYFKKPREPNMIDILDKETWGSDQEEILPDEDDEESDEDDKTVPSVIQEPLPESLTEEERVLELARRHDRQLAEKEQRRKLARVRKKEKIIKRRIEREEHDRWNFPVDTENWTEEDLGEEWAEAPVGARGIGFDPELMTPPAAEDLDKVKAQIKKRSKKQRKDWNKHMEKLKAKRLKMLENPPDKFDPEIFEKGKQDEDTKKGFPVRPYYVPYYRPYPMIPKVHPEVENAMDTLEELEKMEEFLQWASYIFADGSSYEGTVWDDLAHGKGVYTSLYERVQYEGMWLQNMMEGHGVLHVNVPVYQPPPDSKLEKEMRAEGWVLKADLMTPENREWLKKEIEDALEKPGARMKATDLFENDPFWLDLYGELPEKGRYKYSGQWKHNRMHGCGVLDVNTRVVYGKFYFGELLLDNEECTLEACAVHSGLAQVAAAKARMFTKKPDGMVREMDGPFGDPQHPYMYEEDDMWMAPGWVNAYYEVPDEWKVYVEDVDKEQEMWLNSFIKSPLRIPMPAELEYMWENEDEFILLGNDSSMYGLLDEENVLKSHENFQGEILYHVPTGRLINWIHDKDGNVKFFWQPYMKDGSIKPEEAVFLPDGWDEFFSDEPVETGKQTAEELSKEERLKKYKEEDERMQQEWEKEKEESKRKWREDLSEFKEKLKLIAQVEKETVEAELRELDEIDARRKALKEEEKKAAAEMKKESSEAEVVSKIVVESQEQQGIEKTVDAEEKRNDKKPPSFGKVSGGGADEDEEDEDEDEDDKKPRSFGKVAAVSQEDGRKGEDCFPTAFAAMSLSSAPWFRSLSRKAPPTSASTSTPPTPTIGAVKVSCVRKKQQFGKLRAASFGSAAVVTRKKFETVDFQGGARRNRGVAASCSGRKEFLRVLEEDVFSMAIPV